MRNISTKKIQDPEERLKIAKRGIFDIIIFLVLIIIGTILLNKSLNINNEKIINYSEKSNLDYKVYLLENEFYEQKYIGKDDNFSFVASLIDKIVIDFDYIFKSDDNEDINFTYSIIAKLSITNPNTSKTYFDKTYTLLKEKTVSMTSASVQNIKEQVSVDYGYYNSLANSFKRQYGVDSDSTLNVYMLINKKTVDEKNINLNTSNMMNVAVPLTERSIDIHLDYKEINETHDIIKNVGPTFKQIMPLVASILLIIISLILMIRGMRRIRKVLRRKSEYDKYIQKILKGYDRLIAESSTLLKFDDKEIIDIKNFTELLDIHDNLQLPIMFYEAEKHKLAYFYISHDNVIYKHTVDAKDIDK